MSSSSSEIFIAKCTCRLPAPDSTPLFKCTVPPPWTVCIALVHCSPPSPQHFLPTFFLSLQPTYLPRTVSCGIPGLLRNRALWVATQDHCRSIPQSLSARQSWSLCSAPSKVFSAPFAQVHLTSQPHQPRPPSSAPSLGRTFWAARGPEQGQQKQPGRKE